MSHVLYLPSGFALSAASAALGALPASCSVIPANLFGIDCREMGVTTTTGGAGTGTGATAAANFATINVLIMCNSCNQGSLNVPRIGRPRTRTRTLTQTTTTPTGTGTGTGTGRGTGNSICPISIPSSRTITVSGASYLATMNNRGLIGYYCANTQRIPDRTRGASCFRKLNMFIKNCLSLTLFLVYSLPFWLLKYTKVKHLY